MARWLALAFIVFMLIYYYDFTPRETYELESHEEVAIIPIYEDEYLEFVVNLNTKKYHMASCRYANSENAEDKAYWKNEQFLLERGYEPCKKCIIWRH